MIWNNGTNTLSQSLMNLAACHDPRDQMVTDIHRFQTTGIGDVRGMMHAAQGQFDCRDQGYHDIQTLLNRL